MTTPAEKAREIPAWFLNAWDDLSKRLPESWAFSIPNTWTYGVHGHFARAGFNAALAEAATIAENCIMTNGEYDVCCGETIGEAIRARIGEEK